VYTQTKPKVFTWPQDGTVCSVHSCLHVWGGLRLKRNVWATNQVLSCQLAAPLELQRSGRGDMTTFKTAVSGQSRSSVFYITLFFWKEIYSTDRRFIYSIKDLREFGQVNGGLMQTFTCFMEAMLWLWIRSHSTAALERFVHWISHFSRPFETERYSGMDIRIRVRVQCLCWKSLWIHQTHSHPKTHLYWGRTEQTVLHSKECQEWFVKNTR